MASTRKEDQEEACMGMGGEVWEEEEEEEEEEEWARVEMQLVMKFPR